MVIAEKKYKLAILTAHPIQYQVPFFQRLNKNEKIDLTVYFCSDFGVEERIDPGFGIKVKWDKPLLDGYKYKFLKNYSLKPSTGNFFGLVNPGIIKELRKEKYDAVLIYGYGLMNSWLGFLGALLSKTPIILRGETLLLGKQKILKRIILGNLFRLIRAFLPIGKKSTEFYKYYKVSDEKLFLAPYAVDNDYFIQKNKALTSSKEEIKKEIGIKNTFLTIVYVGKIYPLKDVLTLLKSFEGVQERANLVIVGDGQEKKKLEQYTLDKKNKNVYFLGFRNQTELPKYYAVADIFVLPSLREKWGLVVNEAMCAGAAIIVSDGVTAGVDLVKENENGFVYSKQDWEKLLEHLENLVNNPEKTKAMGKRSLEIISKWSYAEDEEAILKALNFIKNGKKQ